VQNLLNMDDMARNEKPTYGDLKMTVQQFFRIDGGSTQLRGVVPDIAFPTSVAAEDFGESSYDNALPWSSIAKSEYETVADLKPMIPMLIARHEARTAKETEWKSMTSEIAEAKKLREEKSISLNEQVRIKERDEQEAKRKAREGLASAADAKAAKVTTAGQDARGDVVDPATKARTTPEQKAADALATTHAAAPTEDDGLQADERSISNDLKREQERKARRDVVLNEAANILIDEVDLIRNDTKLAARIPSPTSEATN
jgi:carboxyl-terminal processing protease